MKRDFRNRGFISIAFLLGSMAMLYTDLFNIFILVAILFNFFSARKEFVANLKSNNGFLKIPLFFFLYIGVHTLILKLFGTETVKYSYSIFESLFFYFIAIPLYVCSMKDTLNRALLKNGLLAFVGGVIIFNIFVFFQLTGEGLYHDPVAAISQLASSRYGANKEIFGGFVFLEPQALYINLAAIIIFYFGIMTRQACRRVGYILLFFLLFFFLMLTETKSAFVSFIAGFSVLVVFMLKGKTWKYKSGMTALMVGVMILLVVFAPASLKERFQVAGTELNNALNDNLSQGGTIVPRVALYKVNFNHFEEFGIWGLGVSYANTVKGWYSGTEYGISGLTDPHNSFMFYWLNGGIPGLLFVAGLFILPLWRMFRSRSFSFIVLSLWIVILLPNNTTVLLSLNDSKPLILFFLALLYWGNGEFRLWEEERIGMLKNA